MAKDQGTKEQESIEQEVKKELEPKKDFTPFHLDRLFKRKAIDEIDKTEEGKKRTLKIVSTIAVILFILWLISLFGHQNGNLIIQVDRNAARTGLIISESADGLSSDPKARLEGGSVEEGMNVTYMPPKEGFEDLLALAEGDTDVRAYGGYIYDGVPYMSGVKTVDFAYLHGRDGNNNGENFLSYTFYVSNTGEETITMTARIETTGATGNLERAIRLAVIEDGALTVFAEPVPVSGDVWIPGEPAEPALDDDGNYPTVPFVSEKVVVEKPGQELKPDDVKRYTVLCWLEGSDPDCTNDKMESRMRATMTFGVSEGGES